MTLYSFLDFVYSNHLIIELILPHVLSDAMNTTIYVKIIHLSFCHPYNLGIEKFNP